MPVDEPLQPSLESTLDEHQDCMRAVQEVEAVLALDPTPADPWLAALMSKLDALRGTLAEHFVHEQDGALYREVPLKSPRLADRIDRLAAEHDTMLATIDGLKQRGDGLAEPETHELRELNGRVQLLIATIRRHEAEENEIIMTAYWTEMGAGD